jgi:hypothetical protein
MDGAVRLEGKCTVGAGEGVGEGAITVGCDRGVYVVGDSMSAQSVAAAMSDAKPCIECGRARPAGGGDVADSFRPEVLRNRLRGTGERAEGSGSLLAADSGSGACGVSHERIVRRASANLSCLVSATNPFSTSHASGRDKGHVPCPQ